MLFIEGLVPEEFHALSLWADKYLRAVRTLLGTPLLMQPIFAKTAIMLWKTCSCHKRLIMPLQSRLSPMSKNVLTAPISSTVIWTKASAKIPMTH